MQINDSHIRLLTDKYQECVAFYRDVLALKPRMIGETYAEIETGNTYFAVFSQEEMAAVAGTTEKPFNHASREHAVLVLEVDDVDAVYAQLVKHGARIITPPQDRKEWGVRTCHFRDPGNNLVEVNTNLPAAE
jgi:lactoylglutathione lyase